MFPIPLFTAAIMASHRAAGTFDDSDGFGRYIPPNFEALDYWSPIILNNVAIIGVLFGVALYNGFDKWSTLVMGWFTTFFVAFAVITFTLFCIAFYEIELK